jgi:RNA-directed DNA polymerase
VVDADIEACFDAIDHTALMGRVRARIADKRVLELVKAFCKAGLLTEAQALQDSDTGTPQGGNLSPLLANIALSVLDDHFAAAWAAMDDFNAPHRRRRGEATYRLIRYADDFVIVVHGTKTHAETLRDQAAAVLAPMGLRLSAAKTKICHIDRASISSASASSGSRNEAARNRPFKPTRPRKQCTRSPGKYGRSPGRDSTCHWWSCSTGSRRSCGAGVPASNTACPRRPSTTYAASRRRVLLWIRRKHCRANWKWIRRHYLTGVAAHRWQRDIVRPGKVTVSRYRYRGRIASP